MLDPHEIRSMAVCLAMHLRNSSAIHGSEFSACIVKFFNVLQAFTRRESFDSMPAQSISSSVSRCSRRCNTLATLRVNVHETQTLQIRARFQLAKQPVAGTIAMTKRMIVVMRAIVIPAKTINFDENVSHKHSEMQQNGSKPIVRSTYHVHPYLNIFRRLYFVRRIIAESPTRTFHCTKIDRR